MRCLSSLWATTTTKQHVMQMSADWCWWSFYGHWWSLMSTDEIWLVTAEPSEWCPALATDVIFYFSKSCTFKDNYCTKRRDIWIWSNKTCLTCDPGFTGEFSTVACSLPTGKVGDGLSRSQAWENGWGSGWIGSVYSYSYGIMSTRACDHEVMPHHSIWPPPFDNVLVIRAQKTD